MSATHHRQNPSDSILKDCQMCQHLPIIKHTHTHLQDMYKYFLPHENKNWQLKLQLLIKSGMYKVQIISFMSMSKSDIRTVNKNIF
jgi:hypothetical protein